MKKKIFLPIMTMMLCLGAGLAAAAWSVRQSTDNFLTMSSYQAKIVEEYKVPKQVNPSECVTKKVNVKNEGTVDILVRVSVKKMFGQRQEDGSFLEDAALDPEMIEIVFNDRIWKKGADGWFYYTEILKAGAITAEPLMEAYTLSAKAGNEYQGKDAQIIVSMESVQAEGNACDVWGVTTEELGISVPELPEGKETGVVFRGENEGFTVNADDTDLFASFKNLLPGCSRTQRITVANDSQTEVEIRLRAEQTRQVGASKRQLLLIKELMEKYAEIEVMQGETRLYRGPVSGKGSEDSMQEEIRLGKFSAGEQKELIVRLAVSSEMDNEYQNLTGKVKWIFSACGEDGKVLVESAPVTGDTSHISMWTALLTASGLAFLIAAALLRRNRGIE